MALVKGICKNFGECDLADNKEVQEVDKTNFVCEECGKPLHPVDGGVSGTGDVKGPNKKLIGIIAAAVLGIGAVGGGIYAWMNRVPNPEPDPNPKAELTLNHTSVDLKVGESDTLIATITPVGTEATFIWQASKKSTAVDVVDGIVTAKEVGESKVQVKAIIGTDTLKAVCVYSVAKQLEPAEDKTDGKTDGKTGGGTDGKTGGGTDGGNSPGKVNLGYGIYEGPRSNHKANGFGGEIRFTSTYSIDLKKASGETVEVNPGDKMVNVKMDNNRIVKGLLKRSDGSQRLIIIG